MIFFWIQGNLLHNIAITIINMNNNGYTLLELLCVLGLMAIISTMTVGLAQRQIENRTLEQDLNILKHTLEAAKISAQTSNHSTEILFNNDEIVLINPIEQLHFRLSGKTEIRLASFPKNTHTILRFSAEGKTDFQNGTFTLTSPHGFEKYLIINQGGRVYIVRNPLATKTT